MILYGDPAQSRPGDRRTTNAWSGTAIKPPPAIPQVPTVQPARIAGPAGGL
jgi:hypothetical protein